MTKDEKQAEARYCWQHSKDYGSPYSGVGTFIHPTGFGKTHNGCTIINNVKAKRPEASVLILVPFSNLVDDWNERIFNMVTNCSDVEVMTVQMYNLNKYFRSPTLLIIDELDEFYSPERMKIITKATCNYTYALGLTATPQDKQRRHIKALEYLPIVHIITEEEALRNNWISDFVQFNLKVNLTDNERYEYDALTATVSNCLGKFGGNYQKALSCLSGDLKTGDTPYIVAIKWATYNGWSSTLDMNKPANVEINNVWNPNKIIGYAKSLNEAVRIRNTLLDNCQAKYNTILEIIEKFYNTKTIIFSQSINFANKIQLLINNKFQQKDNLFDSNYPYCVLYHSLMEAQMVYDEGKNKRVKLGVKRLKEYNLNLVRTNRSKVISSAKALDKGLDIKDIRLALVAGGNSTTNRQQQREGRGKRIEDIPYEKPVIIINLYCDDTKDMRTLKERQAKSITSKIYYISSVDEINLNIENEKNIVKFNI